MKQFKIKYYEIWINSKFFGRYITNEAREAALKKLHNDKTIKSGQIEIKLYFNNPGKI